MVPCLLVVDCDTPISHCRFFSGCVPSASHTTQRHEHFGILSNLLMPGPISSGSADSNSRLIHAPGDVAMHDIVTSLSESGADCSSVVLTKKVFASAAQRFRSSWLRNFLASFNLPRIGEQCSNSWTLAAPLTTVRSTVILHILLLLPQHWTTLKMASFHKTIFFLWPRFLLHHLSAVQFLVFLAEFRSAVARQSLRI